MVFNYLFQDPMYCFFKKQTSGHHISRSSPGVSIQVISTLKMKGHSRGTEGNCDCSREGEREAKDIGEEGRTWKDLYL